jgi:hypothetical protein
MSPAAASRVPAMSAALAVALSARTGQLTAHAVDDMRTKAEELLARHDPLRAAIIAFATGYELHRRDPAELAAIGLTLQAALDAPGPPAPPPAPDPAHWPTPADLHRSDIHG